MIRCFPRIATEQNMIPSCRSVPALSRILNFLSVKVWSRTGLNSSELNIPGSLT